MKLIILKHLLLAIAGILFTNPIQARESSIDSLIIQKQMGMPDTKAKVDSLFKLANALRRQIDIEPILKEAQRVMIKTDYKEFEAKLPDFYGVYLRDHSKYSEAIDLHNKALEIAKLQKDVKTQIIIYNNLGVAYRRLDDFSQSLKYHFEALKLAEQEGDIYSISVAANNIGNAHLSLGNYREAIRYFEQSLSIAEKANNEIGIAMNLNNIGFGYESMNMLDSAMYYYEESLRFNQKINVKKGVAICYNSLGNVLQKQGKINEAISLYKKALSINIELNDKIYIANNYVNLGLAFLDKHQFDESEKNLKESLKIALEIGSKYEAKEAYKGLMQLYEAKKEFKEAFYYGRSYKIYTDSIVNEANSRSVVQMETIYETEKKEFRITALEKERRLMIGLGITIVAALLLTLATFFFLWRWTIQKRKLAESRIKQLEQEKQLVATQAVLDGETRERARLARDLHDGLGSMLTGVKLKLLEMKKGVTMEYPDVERFENALGLLDNSVQEMRRVAHHLMPDSLNRFGLKPAVEDFCSGLSSVRFTYYGIQSRFDPKLEVMIYRCIHELVNNALKYAEANQIMVQIVQEADRIAFTVQDNGRGFDPSAETKGMGLQNIRTRIASYTGILNIDSKEGKGTEVYVELGIRN